MKITSLDFFLFVIISLIVYYVVPKKSQWIVLLCSSLLFFYISCKQLIIYMFVSSLIAFVTGLMIEKMRADFNNKKENLSLEDKKVLKKKVKNKEKIVLITSILSIISFLIYLKYINFISEIVNRIVNTNIVPFVSIALPIGISYYSLMLISYDVDVYRGLIHSETNYFKLLLFTCYFPHVVEGPFNTYKEFINQINIEHIFNYNQFVNEICFLLIGLIKKLVIADRLAFLANEVFDNYQYYGGTPIMLGVIAYTLCLYFDFSGCIDIVSAISKMFGIEMTNNFDKPFFSTNVQEFWRKWHISFGKWLKNYVFYPVSLSKVQKTIVNSIKLKNNYINSLIQSILPLLCVWFVMGIWHGASWEYVLYGLYYFIIILLGMFFEPLFITFFKVTKIKRDGQIWKIIQIIRTNMLVLFGLTLFRVKTFDDFQLLITKLFSSSTGISLLLDRYCANLYIQDLVLAFILAIIFIIYEAYEDKLNVVFVKIMNNNNVRCIFITSCIIFIILFGIYGSGYAEQPSVYAEF